MRKILSVILVFVTIVLSLCACESKQIKDARIAFEEKRYEDVIILLENEEIEDPELLRALNISKGVDSYNKGDYKAAAAYLKEIDLSNDKEIRDLLIISEVYVSFENEDYDNTVKLLSELYTPMTDELEAIRIYSQAHLAYEAKDYELVIDYLGDKLDYADNKIVLYSWEELLEASFNEENIDRIIEYSEKETFPKTFALQTLTKKCDDFDYDSFVLMESLAEELSDGELKDSYVSYLNDNKKTKTKAFLKGTWEIQGEDDDNDKMTVALHVSHDDSQCVGYIIHARETATVYKFFDGELYWKNLEFDDGCLVALNNLAKTKFGREIWTAANVTLYFDSSAIVLEFEERNYFYNVRMVDTNSTWIKISNDYDE